MLRNLIVCALALPMVLTLSTGAHAFSLDWSGTYRAEYFNLADPGLDEQSGKSYMLNHLELSPTVIATDNIKITSEFQVLPNKNEVYRDSQLGQFFGAGLSNDNASEVLSQNQGATELLTTQLYMTWEQEYGSLLVGRVPIDFGLGMTYNGGFNAFDHWHDIRDVVGYKFTLGNFFIFPMIGTVADESVGNGASIEDQMIHLQYENPESGSLFAIFYEGRTGSQSLNDTGDGITEVQTADNEFKSTRVNIAIGRDFDTMTMTVEGGFYSGETGAQNANGQNIAIDSFGIASEIQYHQEGSAYTSGLDLGYASGDDPSTDRTYEGYLFDRNYNVALLLMNHPLGREDFLGTGEQRPAGDVEDVVDVESVSNVIYLSPYLNWAWTETLDVTNRLTYAMLQTEAVVDQDMAMSLGFEWDIGVVYRPHERVEWITEIGLLMPGEAFKAGDQDLENKFTYGIGTKAAISF